MSNSATGEHKALIFGGIVSSLAYLYLAVQTQNYEQPGLIEFWLMALVCGLISFALCAKYQLSGTQVSIPFVLGFAVLFRLIGVGGLPIFEDDFYRYLWDGRMLVEFGTPYGIAPAEFFAAENLDDRFDNILSNINHPHIATIYGPFCQWVFALAYFIAPGEIWPLQCIFGAADLAIVAILLKLAKPNWVLLYAWSPLIIKEFAFTAHPDVVGVALLLGALLMCKREHWVLAGVLMGLAAATKVFALILIPFLIGLRLRAWLAFAITVVLVALPFGLKAAWLPDGLSAMAVAWLFNAPLYFLLEQWFPFQTIKAVLMGVFVIFWGGYLARVIFIKPTIRLRPDYLYGLFFLCIPVVNAWYLVWLLPFAVMYPSMTAWAASLSLLLAYGSGLNIAGSDLGLYQQPALLISLEAVIVLMALTWDITKYRRSNRP